MRVGGFALMLGVLAILLVLAFRALNTPAALPRGSGGHEHGVAHLNVAVEGADIYLEFISPSANLVGFEHPPRTETEKTAVDFAVETLNDAESLIVPSGGARCRLSETTVVTDIGDGPASEVGGARPHEHDEADERQTHSDFTADYHFVCDNPDELTGMDVMVFNSFPGIEHIEVRLLTGTSQAALELTSGSNRILF